jgi:hypothetical protein
MSLIDLSNPSLMQILLLLLMASAFTAFGATYTYALKELMKQARLTNHWFWGKMWGVGLALLQWNCLMLWLGVIYLAANYIGQLNIPVPPSQFLRGFFKTNKKAPRITQGRNYKRPKRTLLLQPGKLISCVSLFELIQKRNFPRQ